MLVEVALVTVASPTLVMVMEMVDPEVVYPKGKEAVAEDARKEKPNVVVATTTIWIDPRFVRPDRAVKEVK